MEGDRRTNRNRTRWDKNKGLEGIGRKDNQKKGLNNERKRKVIKEAEKNI